MTLERFAFLDADGVEVIGSTITVNADQASRLVEALLLALDDIG